MAKQTVTVTMEFTDMELQQITNLASISDCKNYLDPRTVQTMIVDAVTRDTKGYADFVQKMFRERQRREFMATVPDDEKPSAMLRRVKE